MRVHAAGFTPGELDWPGTWTDRAGRDRTPSVPGHELSGVVEELGYGTTGLSVGQRVFGLADWPHNGSLAIQLAREAGARVIGTGRSADQDPALALGGGTLHAHQHAARAAWTFYWHSHSGKGKFQ